LFLLLIVLAFLALVLACSFSPDFAKRIDPDGKRVEALGQLVGYIVVGAVIVLLIAAGVRRGANQSRRDAGDNHWRSIAELERQRRLDYERQMRQWYIQTHGSDPNWPEIHE
jgi:hypothetical protein